MCWLAVCLQRDGENSTSRSILTPYSRGSVFHSAYEEKPSEEAEGSWAKCLRCETGCVTHTKVPVTEALECRPCTGCSHTFYAVNGSTTFLGTEYTVRASPPLARTPLQPSRGLERSSRGEDNRTTQSDSTDRNST